MANASKTHDLMRAVLVIVATAATIIFNALAATGHVNGITPAAISAKYPTVLTPDGYAFSIWTLIYVGLVAFSVFQILPRNLERYRPVRTTYILTCALNCVWIYFWHQERVGVCLAVILLLAATLWYLRYRLMPLDGTGDMWLVKAPIGIYAGWVTAASMVNLMVLLGSMGAVSSRSAANLIGITLIAIAAAAAVVARVTLRDYLFAMAVAWAFTAIAIKQSGDTAIVVATAIGVVICVVTAGSVVVDLRDSTSE